MVDNNTHPLAVLRRAKGLTQSELAALAHVSASQISRLESGAYRPHPATIVALATALGIAAAELRAEIDSVPGVPRCASCNSRCSLGDAWCRSCGEPLR